MEVKVRVRANARREKFDVISPSTFEAAVREKAEGNAANRRIIELVALHFKVPAHSIRIVRGHRSPSKILSIG